MTKKSETKARAAVEATSDFTEGHAVGFQEGHQEGKAEGFVAGQKFEREQFSKALAEAAVAHRNAATVSMAKAEFAAQVVDYLGTAPLASPETK